MKKIIYKVLVLGMVLVIGVGLFCSFNSINVESKDKDDVKTLVIGGDFDYPPFEFLDRNNVYRGFNIDIMKAVIHQMGYNVEFRPMKWEDAFRALENGEIDAIQGVSVIESRKHFLEFSKPYATNEQVIFTLNETNYISEPSDLINKIVAVQESDVNRDLLGFTDDINVKAYPTQSDAVKKLINGKVDAVIGNKSVVTYFLQKEGYVDKVKIVGEPVKKVDYCIATKKGNTKLINEFNIALNSIKSNGDYDLIYKKWFGQAVIYTRDFWIKFSSLLALVIVSVTAIVIGVMTINKKLKEKVLERTRELEEVNKIIAKNEEQYRNFIESSPDAIFVHDENDTVIFVNDEGRRFLGFSSKEDIIGRKINEFINDTSYIKRFRESPERTKMIFQDLKAKKIDGGYVDIEIRVSNINYSGGKKLLSIITDISERKKLVEAIEYDKIKTEFFANISHELRTPLNVILASIQLIDSKNYGCEREAELKMNIEGIRHNSYRLLRLVNNLIDITKIDSGYVCLNMENGNIVDTIEDTVTSVIQYASIKRISVTFDTDEEEILMAYDEDKVERIMLNLLSNAVKFTGENGDIFVDIKRIRDNVKISVKDTGIGMQEEDLSVIFDRFRQVNKTLTRSSEGSGIGLSLVKSLIEMLNGSIEVKSEYGRGTEFIVMLPITHINDDEINKSKSLMHTKDMVDIEFSDVN